MASHATVWTGILSSSATSIAVGDAVVLDTDGYFRVATTANRASYGRSRGIAKSAASGVGATFEYQVAGILGATDSNIGTGTAGDWVIVSATGQLERDATPDSGEDVVGRCPHTTGDVQIMPGVWDSSNTTGGGGGGGATLPINLATDVTGTLPANVGGTGAATHTANTVLLGNGTGALLPGYEVHESNLVKTSKPRVGNGTAQGASEGRGTQAMADANQVLPASVYSRHTVQTTGANTAARTATLPLPASEDEVYYKLAQNDCTGSNVLMANGGGLSTSLPPLAKILLRVSASGVRPAINTVEYLQFEGADGSRMPTTYGVIRVDPYNTRDIISTRLEDNSGDVVLLSHWAPAAGKNELAVGNGQAIGTQVSRLVLSGADFVRALAGSYTGWRAGSSGGVQFHSDSEDFGGGQKVLGIDNATTNPTTNPTGGIVLYVDAADNVLKYRQAAGTTVTLNGAAAVGGANTQVLFNDAGAEAGDAGLTYDKTNDVLTVLGAAKIGGATVAATGTIRLPDVCDIKAITGGVDRPLIAHNGGSMVVGDATNINAIIHRVSSGGFIYNQSGGLNQLTVAVGGVQVGSSTFSLGGGALVMGVTNATTNPSTNPTGGGILYADAGAGKWRGSGGTVTTFGPAEPHCPRCGTDVGISQSENDLFGEELIHCHACELKTGNGVVRHIADFFERKKVA